MKENINKSSFLVSLSLFMLSVWVIYSGWQMNFLQQQVTKLQKSLIEEKVNHKSSPLVVNQAILNAFAEYEYHSNLEATNFWLKVALKSTDKDSNKLCKKALNHMIKLTSGKKLSMELRHDLHLRLRVIIDSYNENSKANKVTGDYNLTHLFKNRNIVLKKPSKMLQLKNALIDLDKKLLDLNNQDLYQKLNNIIDQATDIIESDEAHADYVTSIYTHLSKMQAKLSLSKIVFASLMYCNSITNKVNISDFSNVKFKQ